MSEAEFGAVFRRDGAFVTGVLTRTFDATASDLWRVMIEPASMATWLAPGRIETSVGGKARLDFADSGTVIDSEVTAAEVGRLVEFSWSQPGEPLRPVRWEVAASGAGAVLTVTVKTPTPEDPGKACAGWEAHLAMLTAALAGAPIGFPFETFMAARAAYKPVVAAL
jgi:uncharacterized protein YndB with AHSA1/START domain